jgi:hypothetical protein
MQTRQTPTQENSRKLPDNFRAVRLHLAREPEHPEGDAQHGYDFLMPLKDDGCIDSKTYHAHPQACRVRRFAPVWDEERWLEGSRSARCRRGRLPPI